MTRFVTGIDHVQLAMPKGAEEQARAFYSGVMGLTEIPKPANLAVSGGCWFEGGSAHIHLSGESDYVPPETAHPALLVGDLAAFRAHLAEQGVAFADGKPLEGYLRGDIRDPFGNRIEIMQRL